jgi:hypothetical protein
VRLGGLTSVGGGGQQAEALALERGIAIGVLHEQPRGRRAVVADCRASWPAVVRDQLLEPGEILRVRLFHRLRIQGITGRLVDVGPAEQFGARVLIHGLSMAAPSALHESGDDNRIGTSV